MRRFAARSRDFIGPPDQTKGDADLTYDRNGGCAYLLNGGGGGGGDLETETNYRGYADRGSPNRALPRNFQFPASLFWKLIENREHKGVSLIPSMHEIHFNRKASRGLAPCLRAKLARGVEKK